MSKDQDTDKDLLAPMTTIDQGIPGCHCLVCASSEDLLLSRSFSNSRAVRLAAVCAACGARTPIERVTGPTVNRLITDDEYAARAVAQLWRYWQACTAMMVAAHPRQGDALNLSLDPEIVTDTPPIEFHVALRHAAVLDSDACAPVELTFHDALNLYLARLIEGKTYEDLESCPNLCGDANIAVSYLNTRCRSGAMSSGQTWVTTRTPPNGFGSREEYIVKIGDVAGRAPTFELAAALALLNTVWNSAYVVQTPLLASPGSDDKGLFDKGSDDTGSDSSAE